MILRTHKHLGDNVCMSAVAHNIYQQTHQSVHLWCHQIYRPIFQGNPYVTLESNEAGSTLIQYPGSQSLSDKGNLCRGYSLDALSKLGLKSQVTYNKPQFYMELQKPEGLPDKYIAISAGFNLSATVKNWGRYNWQSFVDRYRDKIPFVQIGAQTRNDFQPYIQGAVSFVGKTDIKQLISVIAFSSGVVCMSSSAVHIAAAFNIPSVYIVGNREGSMLGKYGCTWPAQSNLPCGPCMKFHCSAGIGDPMKVCTIPVVVVNQIVPMCMVKTNINKLFQQKVLKSIGD